MLKLNLFLNKEIIKIVINCIKTLNNVENKLESLNYITKKIANNFPYKKNNTASK